MQPPKTITVTLNEAQCLMARAVGMELQWKAIIHNMRNAHDYDGWGWSEHIEGAGGELAVHSYFGLAWDGRMDSRKQEPDIKELNAEVRTRRHDWHELIVRPDDPPERCFIHVWGSMPTYHIVGWLPGTEARQQRHWKTLPNERAAAWFVPPADLWDIAELRRAE